MAKLLSIAPEFGYVIAVGVGSYVLHHGYMFAKVMAARRKYEVKYPALYADASNCPNEEYRNRFNCVQRGHQNCLENQPIFLSMLTFAGLGYPVTAATAGAAYLIGRILYFEGYSTGKPNGRLIAAPFLAGGMVTLVGAAARLAYVLLRG